MFASDGMRVRVGGCPTRGRSKIAEHRKPGCAAASCSSSTTKWRSRVGSTSIETIPVVPEGLAVPEGRSAREGRPVPRHPTPPVRGAKNAAGATRTFRVEARRWRGVGCCSSRTGSARAAHRPRSNSGSALPSRGEIWCASCWRRAGRVSPICVAYGLAIANAAEHRYAPLLEAGVRVFESRDTMVHAKTAVIDGTWSTDARFSGASGRRSRAS